MCTLTFLPRPSGGFIVTSNRDEAPRRKTLAPLVYEIDGVKTLFPKDAVAGGTWLGISNKKRLVSLLNGGFEPHLPGGNYRMSRGKVVTRLLTADEDLNAIAHFDFSGIEPFTIVSVSWEKDVRLFELVWDGTRAHFSEKPLAPCIWSSSLLYDEGMKKSRQRWFSEFLFRDVSPSIEAILDFHQNAGEEDLATRLVMNRGFVKTKSISQIEKNDDLATFRYHDLETKSISITQF